VEKLAAEFAFSVTVGCMQTSEGTASTRYAGRHRIVDHAAPRVPGYDVVEPIGHGGSGAVWSATSPDGRPVAIKVVQAADADDALVELAVLGRIRDPHLVRLHEAVSLPGGVIALVLDRLDGGTVGSVVRARGHLRPGEVVTALSPVAATLARLHAVGVVHGDLSPDNVLLDLDGRPFVADLGVARIVGESAVEPRGTEGFVAPEVMAGGLPSTAADIHALGALAWFCLTGEAPGPAGLRGRLSERASGVPPELVEIIGQSLRARPEDRPDADALAVGLFESARAEPLVLAHGGDDVSLLTRRIRAAARSTTGAGSGEAAPRAGVRRRFPRLGSVRRRLDSARVRARAASLRGGRGVGVVLRPVVRWVAVAAFVSAAALGGLAWVGSRDGAGAAPAGPTGTGATSAAAPRHGPAAGGADPRLAVDAPHRAPVLLVQALADARAVAWSSGVAARLVEVDAPGSPALARDTDLLAEVQRSRQRYVGLAFVVREAELVAEQGAVVTVRTRIDTGAHVVRSPSGDVRRPAVAAAPVLLDVVHTPSGWRVHDVRPA
jgi:hypothetical protein